MAIEVIRNQPVQTKFNCCSCDEYSRMQLVIPGDEQRIQVKRTPYTTPVFLLNLTPWTTFGDISETPGLLTATGYGTAYKNVTLAAGRTYQIEFDVDITELDDNGGYRLFVNDRYVNLPDATGGSYSIVSGRIVAFYTANTVVALPAIIFQTAVGAVTNLTISNITIAELSQPGMMVLDDAKQLLVNLTNITAVDIPDSNITTFWIHWADVTYTGICYLSFYDLLFFDSNLILNGTFNTSLANWDNYFDETLQWDWFGGIPTRAQYQGTGDSHGNQLTQMVEVPGGSICQLAFTVSGIGIGGGEGCYVSYVINGVATTPTLYSITNAYTETLDLSGYTGLVQVRVVFKPKNVTDTIFIYNVSFKQVADRSNISNPFSLQPKHSGTLVFHGRCDGPAYNFDWTNFFSRLRIRARIEYKGYPDTTELYEWSNKVEELLDADSKKHYLITILGNPEYLHDALRLIRLCDAFTINGKFYVSASDYELKKTEGVCNSAASFEVREKIGLPNNAPGTGDEYADSGYVDEGYW